MEHHAGDGVQRIPGRFTGVVVVQQLGHDLGIGLGNEGVAAVGQPFFDLEVVFDDAVVHHRDLLVAGIMGMRVDHRGFPVGRPAGVPDAAVPRHRLAAVGHLAEYFKAALGFDDLDLARRVLHGQAGRIITAVFKFGQAVQQDRRRLYVACKAYDSTHWYILLF